MTTTGEQVRDFLHVEDVASAIWAVAQSDLVGPVNIGSGLPVTVKEIAEIIATAVGRPDLLKLGVLPYREGDPMYVCADNTLLTQETGWVQSHSITDGIAQTVDWWRDALSRSLTNRVVADASRSGD